MYILLYTGKHSVQECLEALTQSEKLDGNNKYMCSHCQSKQDAERFTGIIYNNNI